MSNQCYVVRERNVLFCLIYTGHNSKPRLTRGRHGYHLNTGVMLQVKGQVVLVSPLEAQGLNAVAHSACVMAFVTPLFSNLPSILKCNYDLLINLSLTIIHY